MQYDKKGEKRIFTSIFLILITKIFWRENGIPYTEADPRNCGGYIFR
jgi:hypothetical protein